MKAVFFDNDGILVDTEHLYLKATQEILRSVDIELTEDQFREYFLVKALGATQIMIEYHVNPEVLNKKLFERDELYSSYLEEGIELISGVLEVLLEFKEKYKLALVTSSKKSHLHLIHKNRDLSEIFDLVLAREDYIQPKPSGECYLKAMSLLNLTSTDVVVVEDSKRGYLAALDAICGVKYRTDA